MMNRQFVILMACSVLAVALTIIVVSEVTFGPALSPAEKGVLLFQHDKLTIKERQPMVVAGLKGPIEIGTVARMGYPPVKLADIAPPDKPAGARVSLVLVRGNKRIAIVDSLVVKEGDSISGGRVARIEKGGVLVKSKEGEQWLTIN